MKQIDEFLESPLCIWAKSILNLTNETLVYELFPNGEYFFAMLKLVDPRLASLSLPKDGHTFDPTRTRLLNLDHILRCVRKFYQQTLNHVLLYKLPDVYQIAKYPDNEETYKEMEKMLELLLGIAISGEHKELFIEQIQTLDTHTQMQLVPYITKVNDDISFSISKQFKLEFNSNSTNILSKSKLKCSSLEELNAFLNSKLIPNLQRIAEERDAYLELIIELEQDKDDLNLKLNNLDYCSNLNSVNNSILNQQANLNQVNELNAPIDFSLCNKSSLINLSGKETITMLLESICKEQMTNSNEPSATIQINVDTEMGKEHVEHVEINLNASDSILVAEKGNLILSGQETSTSGALQFTEAFLLNDLKNRKIVANNWNQKIAIELVECKIKLNKLVNEIEEKCEQIESLKDEIDEVKKQINKLRNENVELQQKAALANVYSDELESLREKSLKAEKYEYEMLKLKEKLDELHTNKSRIDELKEENLILIETRCILEKQLNEYQVRLLSAQRTDSDLNKYKQDIDDLLNQRELDKKRLCELCEKNAKLELDMKHMLNQNVNLDKEINSYKQELTFLTAEMSKQKQLLEQTHQTAQTQAAKLIEAHKLKNSELDNLVNELNLQIKSRDQELSRLKENLRLKEINLDEALVKLKVLNEELGSEQESRIKAEKNLEQHKLEIKELQVRLDDCVNETKKLDLSIRAAAENNEQKETETKENLKKLLDSHEQLNQSYKKLLIDHEHLQKIYLQLESDYEELYAELSKKHSCISSLELELEENKEKSINLEKELQNLKTKKLEDKNVNTDLAESDLEESSLFYQNKFEELNKEIASLKEMRQIVESKVNDLSQTLKTITDENSSLKNENSNLKMQQMQIAQLNDKIQVFESLNEKLEEEKAQLFEQLHLLLQQNQEILVQTLNSKDMYHEETKGYLQQLSNLKRQKEMLEQKIMEQYKSSPSQKTRPSKKTVNSSNSNGLMDIFSSKTRQFVQKVRNKSSSTNNEPNTNLILNVNDICNEDSDSAICTSNEPNNFCHKYSADDINYLNIKPKDQNTVNKCLSSSSSTSSSISPISEQKTPIKLDPKSLKLGGRPQSICSSTCSSPIPPQSPNVVSIKPPAPISDFKRVIMTSSPKYTINQSPSSSSTSSCCSNSSSNKSPIAVITKKANVNSIQLLSRPCVVTPSKGTQKITSKIADSLSKFRLSAEMDKNYDQIETCRIEDDDDDDENEDFTDSEEEFNAKQDKNGLLAKSGSSQAKTTSASGQTSTSNTKNEIWLEYGCI